MKERPCQVYSDLIPSKQITTGQTIIYQSNSSMHDGIQNWKALWAWCNLQLVLRTALATSVYSKLPCINFQWSIILKFYILDMHGTCSCASQTPRVHSICHVKFAPHAPEWAVIWVNFDPTGNWTKNREGMGALSKVDGPSFKITMVYI